MVSGKLRTAPKRCFPFPAAWHPPPTSYTFPLQHAHPLSSQIQTQLTTSVQASFLLQKLFILLLAVLQSLIMLLHQGRKHQAGGCFALRKVGSRRGQKHRDGESDFLLLLQSDEDGVMTDAAEEGFPPTKMQAAPPDIAEGCVEKQ